MRFIIIAGFNAKANMWGEGEVSYHGLSESKLGELDISPKTMLY